LTDTSRSALPPLPGHIRPLPNDDNAALEARYPGLAIDLKHCVTCKGAKTFRWYDGAGRPHSTQAPQTPPVVEYDCPCADQRILHRWLLNGGVTESYQRLGWGDLWYYPEGTKATVDQYLAHADGFIDSGFGLILYGSRGTGKTLLAHLVLKTLISRGYDGYSTSFTQMIDTYAGGWTDKAERNWFNARVRNAGVLLVDDLGRERNKGAGSVGESALEEVIRHRVARSKPTMITSNFSLDQIEGGYGGHTMSLLRERASTCKFEGADRRDEMRQRSTMEITAGLRRPVVLA
jgi:DNA replication protein DnaC